MDIQNSTPKYTTTIQMPLWLRLEIKKAGMTVNGALLMGWEAMQERKTLREDIREVQANLDKYRTRMIALTKIVEARGKSQDTVK